jgi:hypothetical protein
MDIAPRNAVVVTAKEYSVPDNNGSGNNPYDSPHCMGFLLQKDRDACRHDKDRPQCANSANDVYA